MTREFTEARRAELGRILENEAKDSVISGLRMDAFELFEKHGLPGRKNENWKYTSLDPVIQRNAARACTFPDPTGMTQILPELEAIRIEIVNGVATDESVERLRAAGLKATSTVRPETRLVANSEPSLTPYNLNLALLHECLQIQVPDGVCLSTPLLARFSAHGTNGTIATFPRVVIELGRGAQLTVVEFHDGGTGTAQVCTQVNRFELAAGSKLVHYSLQHGDPEDIYLCHSTVEVAGLADYAHHGVQFGGNLTRNETDVALIGEEASVKLSGLFLPAARQHMDNRICVEHVAPRTTSRQRFHGVINDRGRGVYNGKVVVREGAQKTDAAQSNRNLLLSNRAEIDTKPELEIYADDVKCSHGVSTGQLDQDQLFYLLSRGVDVDTARSLLVFAFADTVLAEMAIPEIRQHLEKCLVGELPEADRIREFV